MQSVAECLAKHWKGAFEGGKIQMHEFAAVDMETIQDAETISVRKAGDTLPAEVTPHPVPPIPQPVTATRIPDYSDQPESLGAYARRMKAEKAAQSK